MMPQGHEIAIAACCLPEEMALPGLQVEEPIACPWALWVLCGLQGAHH